MSTPISLLSQAPSTSGSRTAEAILIASRSISGVTALIHLARLVQPDRLSTARSSRLSRLLRATVHAR
jgi:hypothetical protein